MGFLVFPRLSSFGKVTSDQDHAAHCRMAREIKQYSKIDKAKAGESSFLDEFAEEKTQLNFRSVLTHLVCIFFAIRDGYSSSSTRR